MIYGYCRVSTKGQAKDGNSLEAQEKLFWKDTPTQKYILKRILVRQQIDRYLQKSLRI